MIDIDEEDFDDTLIPDKLLEAPVMNPLWPDYFNRIGNALRLDYTTDLHGTVTEYTHRFTMGASVYWPYRDLEDLDKAFGGKPMQLPDAIDPIKLGFKTVSVDRLYIITKDGRQIIFVRSDLPVNAEDRDNSFLVMDLDPSVIAWDPEGLQLLVLPSKGNKEPLFVIRGGGVNITEQAMIIG